MVHKSLPSAVKQCCHLLVSLNEVTRNRKYVFSKEQSKKGKNKGRPSGTFFPFFSGGSDGG